MSKELIEKLREKADSLTTTVGVINLLHEAADAIEAKAAPVGERGSITVLPDGSAFGVMSFPLPKDHWLYAEREYEDGADQPKELPAPILNHGCRGIVEAAVRYAVRGATNCGKEPDFDPDALVQNAVYALCGPFGAAYQRQQAREVVVPERKDESKYCGIGLVAARHWNACLDEFASLNKGAGSHE